MEEQYVLYMTEALTFLCADVFQHTLWFMYTLQGPRGQKGNRGETVSFLCLLSNLSLIFSHLFTLRVQKAELMAIFRLKICFSLSEQGAQGPRVCLHSIVFPSCYNGF